MPNYNISINKELAKIVTREMKEKHYANRSEFFRDLIRKQFIDNDYIIEEVLPGDPDYDLMKKLEKNAEFVEFPL